MVSFSKKILKVYLWQSLAFVLHFVSLFVVVPMISINKPIYGIYTICSSFTIFLSYADLGFLGAGQKFAAEAFAKKDTTEEVKNIGFTAFMLILFLSVLSLFFFGVSFYPESIIEGLKFEKEINIASRLFLVLGIFTPLNVLPRVVQMIFIIRLEDYIYQKVNIIGNIIKIISVYYFFQKERYDVVGYFLFSQIVTILVSFVIIFIAKKMYHYDFKELLKSIHFDKELFNKIKPLAFSLFFASLSWILYYELDSVAIGSFFGADRTAIYAIGLTLLTLVRSILGVLYSPFSVRFNHLIGVKNDEGLKSILNTAVLIYTPVIIFPILTVVFMAEPLVLSWVGDKYLDSVQIVQLLLLCNIFAFVSYPIGLLLIARQQIKEMYIASIITPIVFWLGIFCTKSYLIESSFALFKLIAFIIMAVFYYRVLLRFLDITFLVSLKKYIINVLPSILLLYIVTKILKNSFDYHQSWKDMGMLVVFFVFATSVSLFLYYIISPTYRRELESIFKKLKKQEDYVK